MKILVTGGTIFVSRYVAENFVNKGNEVFVFNRGTHQQVDGTVLIKGDKTKVNNDLAKHNFDLVIAVNIYTETEMKNLIDGLGGKDNVKDFVFISSSAVYPETTKLPFNEKEEVGVNKIWGDYGVNKAAAEKYLLENIPWAYILRPPYLYGKYQNLYREGFVFDCALKDMKFCVPDDGRMKLQFYNVYDLCLFIEVLVDKKPEQHIFNVGNSEVVDINRFVEICYDIAGKKLVRKNIYGNHEQRSYFPFYNYSYYLDVSAQNEIKAPTVSLYDGLKEDFEYYKEHQNEVMKKITYFDYIENVLSK